MMVAFFTLRTAIGTHDPFDNQIDGLSHPRPGGSKRSLALGARCSADSVGLNLSRPQDLSREALAGFVPFRLRSGNAAFSLSARRHEDSLVSLLGSGNDFCSLSLSRSDPGENIARQAFTTFPGNMNRVRFSSHARRAR